MPLRGTAISRSSRGFCSPDGRRLGVIATSVPLYCRAGRETPPRSAETDGKTVIVLDKTKRNPPCRVGRKTAPSDGYDENLLRNVARGDASAMRTIFLRHKQRVFRFVLRIVRRHDLAQDIVSQVFLDVWRFAHRFEYRSRVSTWLLSIARFKAINAMRRPAHQKLDELGQSETVDTSDTPEMVLNRKETSEILRACLAELSPVHRQMLDLFYYHDCSVAEVSEKVGIPKATVKSRLFYARKQLARVLVSAGFSTDTVQSDLR